MVGGVSKRCNTHKVSVGDVPLATRGRGFKARESTIVRLYEWIYYDRFMNTSLIMIIWGRSTYKFVYTIFPVYVLLLTSHTLLFKNWSFFLFWSKLFVNIIIIILFKQREKYLKKRERKWKKKKSSSNRGGNLKLLKEN